MLLTGSGRRLFLAAVCAVSPYLLSACAVRMDTPDRATGGECAAPKKALFGIRRDTSSDPYRTVRAKNLAGDPKEEPTPREQRAARALALAEKEIISRNGGAIMYRSDGSSSSAQSVTFVESSGALTLEYAAADRLNRVDDIPHALLLVVYHLSDRAALDQLARHEDGIRKLLAGELFDEAVKSVRKHYIQPGATGTLRLDRPEGGRFVAIVAGYAELSKSTSLHVAEYGLGQWYAPGASTFQRRRAMYSPLPMHVLVTLDEQSMSVKNTGRIYGGTRNVHQLMAEQVQYLTTENFFWAQPSGVLE